jgi:YfiR/HmsC-like
MAVVMRASLTSHLVRIACAAGAAAAMLGIAHATQSEVMPESAVKAAYLSKFGMFVAWPKPTPAASEPLVVCVAGENPFGDFLNKAVRGQRVAERPVVARYVREVTRETGCDILYVAATDRASAAGMLNAVNGAAVLTVTDAAPDDRSRGIIDFVVQNQRVRFTIDDSAAAKNGITISSHLFSLALSVRPRS